MRHPQRSSFDYPNAHICAPVATHSSPRIAARQSATHFAVVSTRNDAAAAMAVPVPPATAPAHVSKLLTGEGFGESGWGTHLMRE